MPVSDRLVAVNLVADLRAAVRDVVTDPAVVAGYTTDWTRRFTGVAVAVARPRTADEVGAVLAACAEHAAAVIPQGGNTGLVGASVPGADGGRQQVVLSLLGLTGIGEVDTRASSVVAGAGVTLSALQRHAVAAGVRYGVDLGARDSATVGGTLATNAGGLRVLAYGDTRAQVSGVQAVLADGSVIDSTAGPLVDSSGYDLAGLMVGSEGTLGIITAARLRLVPPPPNSTLVLAGVTGIDTALDLLDQPDLLAAEYLDDATLRIAQQATGLPDPLSSRWPGYVLLDVVGTPRVPDSVDAVAGDLRLWQYRERAPEAIAATGVVHKMDVALPLTALAGFVESLPQVVSPPAQVFVYGHLGVGNLHINVLGPDADDESVDAAVLQSVAAAGGSISAEHGVGRAKRQYLSMTRSAAEIEAMSRIKAALDPAGLLNPGVLVG